MNCFTCGSSHMVDLRSMDKLEYSIELINGLRDNMIQLPVKQGKELSAIVLCVFEAVLEKISLLFCEIEESACRNTEDGCRYRKCN